MSKPIDDFNHLMDAMRYAVEKYIKGNRNMGMTNQPFIRI